MFKVLEHLFITKKYPKEMDEEKRSAYGILSSILGIICNIFLCLAKIIVGLIFASISIVIDGFNNLSDSTSSIVSLIGFKIAKKSPDKDHPYGHERIEYVSALLVSCSIIVLSIILGKTSVERIINNSQMDLSRFYIIVILLALSIIIKIWMVFVYKYPEVPISKTSTKLFLAAATLGLAAASTIGSTYAWFTINGSAKVSGFDMKVAGDTGVFIREHCFAYLIVKK